MFPRCVFLFLAGAGLLIGCSGSAPMMDDSFAGEGYFFVSGRFYNESYSEVFEALRQRLIRKGYSLNRVDKDAGIISTFSRPLEGIENSYCDCRTLHGFYELGRKVKMTFTVTEVAPTRTRITVRSRITAYWSDGQRTIDRACASNGTMEKDVLRF